MRKILYKGKVQEVKPNQYGHLISEEGELLALSEDGALIKGEEYVEPVEEVIVDDTI